MITVVWLKSKNLGKCYISDTPLSTTYSLMVADKNGKNLSLASNTDAYISAHKT